MNLYLECSVKGEMFSEQMKLWHMTCHKVGAATEAGIGVSFMVLSPYENVRLVFFFLLLKTLCFKKLNNKHLQLYKVLPTPSHISISQPPPTLS